MSQALLGQLSHLGLVLCPGRHGQYFQHLALHQLRGHLPVGCHHVSHHYHAAVLKLNAGAEQQRLQDFQPVRCLGGEATRGRWQACPTLPLQPTGRSTKQQPCFQSWQCPWKSRPVAEDRASCLPRLTEQGALFRKCVLLCVHESWLTQTYHLGNPDTDLWQQRGQDRQRSRSCPTKPLIFFSTVQNQQFEPIAVFGQKQLCHLYER